MKTLKLLAITIFLLVTNSIVAQEKQNDATWKETIAFINKYSYLIDKVGVVGKGGDADDEPLWNDFTILWTENELHVKLNGFKINNSSSEKYFKQVLKTRYNSFQMPLNKLSRFNDYNYCLYFSAEKEVIYDEIYIAHKYVLGNYEKKGYWKQTDRQERPSRKRIINEICFEFKSDENVNRIRKALKHLAYLATEKRKKEREASGDKF